MSARGREITSGQTKREGEHHFISCVCVDMVKAHSAEQHGPVAMAVFALSLVTFLRHMQGHGAVAYVDGLMRLSVFELFHHLFSSSYQI